MDKFSGKQSDNSIWLSMTPTIMTKQLPFYIVEAGHFTVYSDYSVKRDFHDSYLFLYTRTGNGCIKTGDIVMNLTPKTAIVIDCHNMHEYFSESEKWEFSWIHFKGSGVKAVFDTIYPNGDVQTVDMENDGGFSDFINSIIKRASKNDIKTCIDISADIHRLINRMYAAFIELEEYKRKKDSEDYIHTVIEYIKANYSQQISVDDMVNTIHISKYYFIRCFSRIMGVTPYNYLTNYRITMAKTMLRTTDKTVSEIAQECGFMDTSNFIVKFKKHTNQKPMQYRHDFT